MHLHDKIVEKGLAEAVYKMLEVGYNASEQDSLPFLFKEVHGYPLRKCSDCYKSAWSFFKMFKIARQKKNNYMGYTIKKEYEGKDFIFMSGGVRVVVNSGNLNEERARMILSSKYAHVINGIPDKIEPTAVVVKPIKSPNESEVATVSTSKEAKQDGKPSVFAVKGKLSKSPELKRKPGRPSRKENERVG